MLTGPPLFTPFCSRLDNLLAQLENIVRLLTETENRTRFVPLVCVIFDIGVSWNYAFGEPKWTPRIVSFTRPVTILHYVDIPSRVMSSFLIRTVRMSRAHDFWNASVFYMHSRRMSIDLFPRRCIRTLTCVIRRWLSRMTALLDDGPIKKHSLYGDEGRNPAFFMWWTAECRLLAEDMFQFIFMHI